MALARGMAKPFSKVRWHLGSPGSRQQSLESCAASAEAPAAGLRQQGRS